MNMEQQNNSQLKHKIRKKTVSHLRKKSVFIFCEPSFFSRGLAQKMQQEDKEMSQVEELY